MTRRARWRAYRRAVREVRAGRVRRLHPVGLTGWVLEVECGVPACPVRVEYGGWVEVATAVGWVSVSSSGRAMRRALLGQFPQSALVDRICRGGAS